MNYNNIALTVFALASMVGIWYLYRKYEELPENKGLEFGVLAKKLIVTRLSSIYVLTTTLLTISESLMAASVAGTDDRVSVIARFGAHVTIGFLAFVGALSWVKTLANFVTAIQERDGTKIVVRFMLLIIILLLTFGMPVANTLLLAHAFHQSPQLHLFWLSIMGTQQAYINALLEYGFNMPYHSWSSLHNAIAASLVLNLASLLIIAIESLNAFLSMDGTHMFDEERAENDAPPDKKEDKGGEEKDPSADKDKPKKDEGDGAKKLKDNLKTLVSFFYDGDDAKVERSMRQIDTVLASRKAEESMATGFSATLLAKEIEGVDKKNAENVKKLKTKISEFIGGSKHGQKDPDGKVTTPAGGLGVVLSKK